jgi:hypothetical protein
VKIYAEQFILFKFKGYIEMEGQNNDYRNYIGQTANDYEIQKFRKILGDDEMQE